VYLAAAEMVEEDVKRNKRQALRDKLRKRK